MTVRERERNSKNDSQETGGCDTEDQGSRDLIKKKVGYVHSQVLRIREEDSHLGEERLSAAKEMIRKALIGKLQESFGLSCLARLLAAKLQSRPCTKNCSSVNYKDLLLMEDELEVKEMQFVN
ncbi:hypothetical protein NC652_038115 [Populus alba x Populus x berolinensis]|nr:hypothetical protein NC652_038115 [Populus alba x Populus x berolinensis]